MCALRRRGKEIVRGKGRLESVSYVRDGVLCVSV